jgi:hypothetical protein
MPGKLPASGTIVFSLLISGCGLLAVFRSDPRFSVFFGFQQQWWRTV